MDKIVNVKLYWNDYRVAADFLETLWRLGIINNWDAITHPWEDYKSGHRYTINNLGDYEKL